MGSRTQAIWAFGLLSAAVACGSKAGGVQPAASAAGMSGADAVAGAEPMPAAGSGGSSASGAPARDTSAAGRAAAVAAGSSAGAPSTPAAAGSNAGAPSTPAATGCTRESLRAQVDGYFAALAAHDPGKLPQAANLKFTENAMPMKLGEGLLWKTAAAAKLTRSLYDTERCGTVTEAVLPNSGTDTIFGLRLKVVDQKLTEIESIVVDPEDGFFPTPMGILNSKAEVWDEILPPDQRSTREQLEAAGKAYFDWFGDSSIKPPFATPCDRLENGFKTTQGSCGNLGGAMGLKHPAQRYPFSDLDAGITAGFVLFAGADIDFHMFKVVGGKIKRIDAVVGPAVRSAGW